MIAAYTTAVEALVNSLKGIVQKKPATGETLQQALTKVEIEIDRASTMPTAQSQSIAMLLNLRNQLLTASKICFYAQPSEY